MTANAGNGAPDQSQSGLRDPRAGSGAGPGGEAFDYLLSVLVPGEEIVWSGRADRVVSATRTAQRGLLWAGVIGAVVTALFLIEGWFAILLLFALVPAYDLIAAGRTYYAVTTERVLVVRTWPRRSVEILLPAWIVEVRRTGGIGGPESLEIRQTEVTGVRMFSNMFRESREGPVLTLYGIEGIDVAAAAIDRLRSWRRPLVAPSLQPVDTVARDEGPSDRETVQEASADHGGWVPETGETVVWTGRPSPWAVGWNGLRRALGLAAIAIGMIAVGGAVLVLFGRFEALMLLGWLSLIPGLGAVGALIQAAWDAAAATRCRFVITDARVVVIDDWLSKKERFLLLSSGLTVEWKRQAGDRGTIVIRAARPGTGGLPWDHLRRRRKPLLVMHGVSGAEEAMAALDRLLERSGRT